MQAHGATANEREQGIVSYSYASAASRPGGSETLQFPEIDTFGNPAAAQEVSIDSTLREAFDLRLAQEKQLSFAEGHAQGIEEGRQAERAEYAASQSAESTHRAAELSRLADRFAAERDSYLARVESEVVRLALAISARILRREAQTDPLLLLGAVRVALGQLAGNTRVRLRVPSAHHALWLEAVALLPARSLKPEIVSDESMRLGDCTLESDLGSADLGLAPQLSDIERRLCDPPREAPGELSAADGASREQP